MAKLEAKQIRNPSQIAGLVAGAANFLARIRAGIVVSARATLIGAQTRIGIVIRQAPAQLRTIVKPGIAISSRATGTLRALIKPGVAIALRATGTPVRPLIKPGVQVIYTRVELVRTVNGTGSVIYAVGADNDWTTPANFDGKTSAEASITGGKGTLSLTEKGGGVECDFPPPVNKDAITITSVKLKFYTRQTGTLLSNGSLKVGYRLGSSGSRIQLAAYTGDRDGEDAFDLTPTITTWAQIAQIKAWVEGKSANLGRSCYARYAELEIKGYSQVAQ